MAGQEAVERPAGVATFPSVPQGTCISCQYCPVLALRQSVLSPLPRGAAKQCWRGGSSEPVVCSASLPEMKYNSLTVTTGLHDVMNSTASEWGYLGLEVTTKPNSPIQKHLAIRNVYCLSLKTEIQRMHSPGLVPSAAGHLPRVPPPQAVTAGPPTDEVRPPRPEE